MATHLLFAFFLYLGTLSPLAYLGLKLPWSAFRVFIAWLLLSSFFLIPLVWIDFRLYSELAWPCRAVTWMLEFVVFYDLCHWHPFDTKGDAILVGMLILELFPAISETQAVMMHGGWLRLVPTLSCWIACAVWISGVRSKSARTQLAR